MFLCGAALKEQILKQMRFTGLLLLKKGFDHFGKRFIHWFIYSETLSCVFDPNSRCNKRFKLLLFPHPPDISHFNVQKVNHRFIY